VIKKTEYVQLTLLILFVFLLFVLMSSSITFQEDTDNYGTQAYSAQNGGTQRTEEQAWEDGIVVLYGNNNTVGENITHSLECLKKGYFFYRSMDEVPEGVLEQMKLLILCSATMEDCYEYQEILELAERGVDMVFAVLPVTELDNDWKQFLGIRYAGDVYEQKGLISLSGFLVGGLRWYEKCRLQTWRVKVNASCKTYLAGLADTKQQSQMRNEDATDIIWRNIYGDSRIFVVNGRLFETMEHFGLLNAIFAKLQEDYLYPIINAKMVFIENAPFLSNENDQEMQQRYARTAGRFFEEIAVPGIVSLSLSLGLQPQFYGTQYFQDSSGGIDSSGVSFLYRELDKIGGNIQVSAYDNRVDRMVRSIKVFESVSEQNVTSLLLQGEDENTQKQVLSALDYAGHISSIVREWGTQPELCVDEAGYVHIPIFTKGYEMPDSLLFPFDTAASALGFISHGIDMQQIIYPEGTENDWAEVYKDFSAGFYTACQKYNYLQGVGGTELESRVRQYLDLKPYIVYEEEKIYVEAGGLQKKAYFILQTGKHVKGMSSGKYEKLEDGTYLITITNQKTDIYLETE